MDLQPKTYEGHMPQWGEKNISTMSLQDYICPKYEFLELAMELPAHCPSFDSSLIYQRVCEDKVMCFKMKSIGNKTMSSMETLDDFDEYFSFVEISPQSGDGGLCNEPVVNAYIATLKRYDQNQKRICVETTMTNSHKLVQNMNKLHKHLQKVQT